MSALYQLKVLQFQEASIKLSVQVIHPDSNEIYESPGFALMLLHDHADIGSALGGEIDSETLYNDSWMQENARGYIRSVRVELNKPSRRGWLNGTMEIETTDPAWLAHMEGIKEWDSAAYDPARQYDECAPILPEILVAPTLSDTDRESREGFMPVWKYMIPSYLLTSNKEILWLPQYGQMAYTSDEANIITDLGEESMRAHEGKLVITAKGFGVLYRREDDWGVFKNGVTSSGSSYIEGDSLTPMLFNTSRKKKLSYPMTVSQMVVWSSPLVFDASIQGDTIELKVMVMNEGQSVFLHSSKSALEFLMKPFETFFGKDYEAGWPLSNLLNPLMKEKNIRDTWSVYMNHKDIADQIIVSSTVEKSSDIPFPELDGLSNEEIIACYAFDKWPQYTIKIQVSDPALLEGYAQKLPFEHIFGRLGEHLVR